MRLGPAPNRLAVALALGLLAAPVVARAQGKVARIGYLSAGSRTALVQVFEDALRERGWVPGQNLLITYRYAEGKYERLPALAAELVRLEPQAILAVPTPAARAAKAATSTIPIVMWGVPDPVGEGLIASFARPGGNVTGLTGVMPFESLAKQLQLLKETVPRAQRIAFLHNPTNPAAHAPKAIKLVEETARSLGIELQVIGASAPEQFETAFQTMARARAEALLFRGDPVFFPRVAQLAELAIRHRLPTISEDYGYAQAGGLIGYTVNRVETVRQSAGYMDKVLRGARPAELPVEQPTKFELVINLKTAKALGITIPPSVRLQADQVIE